ncbi:UNVERIFIED_CONTAM: hypothetical protein NCL1_49188 [Trichonephila clavipes]
MFTITFQHMSCEVQLQQTFLYRPLTIGGDSLPDLKLLLAENGKDILPSRFELRTPSFSTSIMSDDVERTCFPKLTM